MMAVIWLCEREPVTRSEGVYDSGCDLRARIDRTTVILIKPDLLWVFAVNDSPLPQVGRCLKLANLYRDRMHVIANIGFQFWGNRQSVIARIPDGATGHQKHKCENCCRRNSSCRHWFPPCLGTARSFGCLIRTRLHGRSFTDSVSSFRFSVAMRRFSSV